MNKFVLFDRLRPLFGKISGSQVVVIDTLVNEAIKAGTGRDVIAAHLASATMQTAETATVAAFADALQSAGYPFPNV